MRQALLLAVAALPFLVSGCFTPRVRPEPSSAVVEARARAQAARTAKTDPCGAYAFELSKPIRIHFPYNKTELTEDGAATLDHAAVWLGCHPDVWVSLSAVDDNQGTAQDQAALVQARLAALRARLTAGGVHPDRLLAYTPKGEALMLEGRGRGW